MWLNGSNNINDDHSSTNSNRNSSNSNSIFSGSATTTLAAATVRLASGAGAAVAGFQQQQQRLIGNEGQLVSTASPVARVTKHLGEPSSPGSATQQSIQLQPQPTDPSTSSNVQLQQPRSSINLSSSSSVMTQHQHPVDTPEKISFHLKTSIFTRRVTIDRDKLALGSIKQLAIAFLNELYFQHSYPTNTYIGDYIREHYNNRDNLSHLYERLILRKYSCHPTKCCDSNSVPFNSVGDIEPESFISIEVAERTSSSSRHHLLNKPTTIATNSIAITTSQQQPSSSSVSSSLNAVAQNPHHQKSLLTPTLPDELATLSSAATTTSSTTNSTLTAFGGSSTSSSNQHINSLSSSSSSSQQQQQQLQIGANLMIMTHDFKQESYLKFTYCASCSHLIKGIIFQGYQCKNCKKNYCSDCKQRAEAPGSSDSCLVPVNSAANLIGGGGGSSNSPLTNLFASSSSSSRNNNNSIDIAHNSEQMQQNNNPGSPSNSPSGNSNKLEISHTNMSKRKSASNLLQHLNLANPFKTHHTQHQQQSAPKEDKSKSMRGSAGALEPVLHQLSKQREHEQQQRQQHHPMPSNESSTSGSGSNSGGCNTLLVAQTAQLSSSHQNLFMNGKEDASKRPEGAGSAAGQEEAGAGLQRLSNSARTSAADLHGIGGGGAGGSGSSANKTPIKRDQANHSFTLMDLHLSQKSATATTTTGAAANYDQRCDVCNKSLKSSQQQPLICKSCKLHVHSNCQNLVLTDCMSRIAESIRAAAAAAVAMNMDDDPALQLDPTGCGDTRAAIQSTNSNVSRDNIRLHRLAPSVKHVKRPDLTKPILEGWLKHTTLSDEQARRHYWRLDGTDLTLYEDDKSTRYFKAIALNKITRVMSSHSLPKQIREDVLLTSALLSGATSNNNKQSSTSAVIIGAEQTTSTKARSANTSPIKTPELQAQMKAMFAFELATGCMYLVQAQSELEASKWRQFLATVTGKTNQPEDKHHQQQQAAVASAAQAAALPAATSGKKATEQQQPSAQLQQQPGTLDKLIESVNRIDLQKDRTLEPAHKGPATRNHDELSPDSRPATLGHVDKNGHRTDSKTTTTTTTTDTSDNCPQSGRAAPVVVQEKQPRQPAVQRQHHHRYPPSGHRRANFTDPNRSRLYNRPRKEIKLNKMDIPDHLIEAKYLVEKDHTKGHGFVELGSGQFGKVYAAISEYKPAGADESIWSGVPVAIKEISKARFDLRQQAKLKNEANILSGLDHPGVITLERVHDLPDRIYIVMEQLEDDMLEMIVSTPEKRLNERVTKFLTYQILEALKYLHAQKIAHCDLKPENVLLVDKHTYPQIKLCDFGFAKIIEENSFRSSLVGTPAYLAPEIVKGERYNRSVDLWSVGVIVYVSLSGEFPFNEGENIHDQISRANFMYPKQIWGDVSQQAMDFINSLLRVNCEKRLSASTAQMDVWIQEFQLWCDLCDLELRVGKRWVTDDADFDRWSRYARENGRRVPSSAVQLHMSLNVD